MLSITQGVSCGLREGNSVEALNYYLNLLSHMAPKTDYLLITYREHCFYFVNLRYGDFPSLAFSATITDKFISFIFSGMHKNKYVLLKHVHPKRQVSIMRAILGCQYRLITTITALHHKSYSHRFWLGTNPLLPHLLLTRLLEHKTSIKRF